MRINIAMLRRSFRRLLAGRAVDMRALAARRWVVCLGEQVLIPPALHLSGAMDKVQRLCTTREPDAERLLLHGGYIQHAPTEAYVVENVDLTGAFLYAGAAKLQPGFGAERVLLRNHPRKERIRTATLMSNNSGSHYFGNFLWDDLPLELLDSDPESHISVQKKPYSHEPGYREILGARAPRIVSNASIDSLTLFKDFAQNSSKEARLRTLRARLRSCFGTKRANTRTGVFVRRGLTGERRVMENEAQIEDFLAAQNFAIIDPAAMTPHEIARQCLDARLVVGVEGSHLAHALYTLADDGAFLVLQPPRRFSLVHKEFADRMGMRYAFLVGDRSADGFTIPIDDVRRMLDRLL